MLSRWTQHLKTPEEKEHFEREIRNARIVLERLSQILQEEQSILASAELKAEMFDNPNWANKQAFVLGMKAGLSIPIKLSDLDKQAQRSTQIDR